MPSNPAPTLRSTWKWAALYYAIACGWAWLAWSPVVLGNDGLKLIHWNASLPVFSCIATLGPSFGCFITHRLESGNWRAVRLLPHAPLRWLWLFLGPLVVLVSFFVVFPAFISQGSPAHWHWHPSVLLGLWLPMFNYNLLGGPLFEEFGWRGYLQTRLQQVMMPWKAATCVGILWATWHAPLFFVPWSSASPQTFLLTLLGLAIWMACAFNGSGRAVLAAILMHAAFNASSQFVDPFLTGTSTRSHPSPELLIAFAFLLPAILAIFLTRGRLNAPAMQATQSQTAEA